jgi:hypothetical protein
MSGVPGRIFDSSIPKQNIKIHGFNGSQSSVSAVGLNDDGKMEYYVPHMPSDLVLLSAHSYAEDGAAVLFPDGGGIYKLSDSQRNEFVNFLSKFPITSKLTVVDRTYEIDSSPTEQAYNSSATKYFNSKVNVSNTTERILAQLLTGLSYIDLFSMVNNESVDGLPRDITKESLKTFSRHYGRTPDVVQLSRPNLAGNVKGYLAPTPVLSHVGQRVEADFLQPDFNYEVKDRVSGRIQTKKIPTFGGATYAFVAVDCYSGMVHGRLTTTTANVAEHVRWVVDQFVTHDHNIQLFVAIKVLLGLVYGK